MVENDVFISHSSNDRDDALKICGSLEKNGICCWIAPRDVDAGTDYGSSIIEGLSSSRILLLVFSRHSNASKQVLREVERAVSKGIKVVPVRIEDIIPSSGMEYFISTTQWIDAFPGDVEGHTEDILRQVEGLLIRGVGEDFSGKDLNHIAFNLGKELSLYVMYGEERTKGRLWILRSFNCLGLNGEELKGLIAPLEKDERVLAFKRYFDRIHEEIKKNQSELTASWFDLGLTMTLISAMVLSDLDPGEKRDIIGSLLSSSNRCVEELKMDNLIDLDPLRDWIESEGASDDDKKQLFEHMLDQFGMIESRFGG